MSKVITLYFNVLSTVLRKNKKTDFLIIYIKRVSNKLNPNPYPEFQIKIVFVPAVSGELF